jgi:hypothetical protein
MTQTMCAHVNKKKRYGKIYGERYSMQTAIKVNWKALTLGKIDLVQNGYKR